MMVPPILGGQLLPNVSYSAYRLAVVGVGLLIAVGLYILIQHTRLEMWMRVGASNRTMIDVLRGNITWLYTLVFGLEAGLAGLAGMMVGPILALQVSMGESILILTFVVIVIVS